jgi:copper chaperone CopZ
MKKIILLLCIVTIGMAACKTNTTDTNTEKATADVIVNPDALIQMDIIVSGMTCTGCENTINSGLTELKGVVDVESSFEVGKTIVTYDSTLTNMDNISKVIADKGYSITAYNVHVVEEEASPAAE